jgi:hypothetical protein
MKIKNLLLAGLLTWGVAGFSQAQKDVWTLGKNVVKFNSTGVQSITSLPLNIYPPSTVPPYTINPWTVDFASLSISNCYNDASGNLLFYIADSKVYDKDGLLIGELHRETAFYGVTGTYEYIIVPHKCNPKIFYIVGSPRKSSSHQPTDTRTLYTKLEIGTDLNSTPIPALADPNYISMYGDPLADGRLGFSNSTMESGVYTDLAVNMVELFNPYSTGGQNYGSYTYALSRQQKDGDRLLFLNSSGSGLVIFKTNDLEPSALNGTSPTPLYNNSSLNAPTTGAECELIQLANGTLRVINSDETFVSPIYRCFYRDFTYTPATLALPASITAGSTNSICSTAQFAPYATGGGAKPIFHGIEMDPSGRYLYFTVDNTTHHLFYVDLNASTPTPTPVIANAATSNTYFGAYKYSQLEIGKGGNLFMLKSDKIAWLTGINNPSTITTSNFYDMSLPNTVQMISPTSNAYGVVMGEFYGLNDQVDGDTIKNPVVTLNPTSATDKATYCQGETVTLSGSATGSINGNVVPDMIGSHVWVIAPCDAAGNVTGTEWWSAWGGSTITTFTLSTNAGSTPFGSCNQRYKVKLAVMGKECGDWSESVTYIYVACKPNVTLTGNTTVCRGSSSTLCVNPPRGGTVYWDVNTLVLINSACATIVPSQNYAGSVTVGNQYGCTTTIPVPITVIENNPNFYITPTQLSGGTIFTVSIAPQDLSASSVPGFQSYYVVEQITSSGTLMSGTQTPTTYATAFSCWKDNMSTTFNLNGYSGGPTVNCSSSTAAQLVSGNYYRVTRWTKNNYCSWTSAFARVMASGTFRMISSIESEINSTEADATSIDDVKFERKLSLFPNPTSGLVKIDSKETVKSIHVTSITGAVIADVKDVNEVDLSDYPSGMYFFIIATESGKQTLKVIKE